MARSYPALEFRWPLPPSTSDQERLLAALDDDAPTAAEEIDGGVRVFFATESARDRAIRSAAEFDPTVTVTPIDVSDEDWAERSQASLGPVTVGRFVVVPRRDKDTRSRLQTTPGVVLLVIAPSMGFGTGHHASTRLCLRLLQERPLAGASVIDVGTGSGVLAIAARKLGAGPVVATDIDLDALQSARENLELNQEGGVRLEAIDLLDAPAAFARTFDVVLANLTGAVLARHAGAIAELAAPGGRLIASGFQPPEVDDVVGALDRAGWALASRVDEDDWVGAAFERGGRLTSPTRSTAR